MHSVFLSDALYSKYVHRSFRRFRPPSPIVDAAALVHRCVVQNVRCMPVGGCDQTKIGCGSMADTFSVWLTDYSTIGRNVMHFKRPTDHPLTFSSSLVSSTKTHTHDSSCFRHQRSTFSLSPSRYRHEKKGRQRNNFVIVIVDENNTFQGYR